MVSNVFLHKVMGMIEKIWCCFLSVNLLWIWLRVYFWNGWVHRQAFGTPIPSPGLEPTLAKEQVFRKLGDVPIHFKNRRAIIFINQNSWMSNRHRTDIKLIYSNLYLGYISKKKFQNVQRRTWTKNDEAWMTRTTMAVSAPRLRTWNAV